MNISKLALIALLGSALTAFGCSSDPDGGGGGGAGGAGGAIDPLCQPVAGECTSGAVDAITQCPVENCDLPQPPNIPTDACTGSESTDNPDSCASLGTGGAGGGNDTVTTYQLTFMQAPEDCNKGFNLDDCNGETCKASAATLSSPDGADGVDNGLSSLQPALVEIGASLTNVNQAFYDSLCGRTNSPAHGACEGGTMDGVACIVDLKCSGTQTDCTPTGDECTAPATCVDVSCPDGAAEACPAGDTGCTCSGTATACTADATCTAPATCVLTDPGTCNTEDDDCLVPIPAAVITYEVDANSASNCATVTVRSIGACSGSGICSTTNATACTSIIDCPAGEICVNTTACDADTGDMGCTAPATCEGGGTTTSFLNLSAANADGNSCLSGELEPIPTLILTVPATLGNPSVRMTLSSDGFSHGVLGATIDEATAKLIAASISEEAVLVIPLAFDISETLTQDTSAACNALSMGLEIGGVTVPN